MTPDLPLSPAPGIRTKTGDELRSIALQQFASVGFAATSLQHIADAAGFSKSTVLYHFASKEALLADLLTPAVDGLTQILERYVDAGQTAASRVQFIDDFIDFLLQYRLELHTFINQGQSLGGIDVVDRARELIVRLSDTLCREDASVEEHLRFAVALGGAAYSLVAGMTFLGKDLAPVDHLRPALRTVITELLAPVTSRHLPGKQ
ncbi:TetR/AcrR family transcriptional regulator [Cryobacterium sp. CG_9.6]|uniref:TetR/AcrR family transcriptional regulator n=1 Tax=Cryobacterium sp. CG_9.6 TaxID=2760710 RepID=UPI002473B558|nr:TetR/AcrR family transcriptional regulator [Cryobacterium sp. CG_9.6]MDH6236364.1 AcrR family transcriptional regulator [Cryobacterium sp. CG_9.6]